MATRAEAIFWSSIFTRSRYPFVDGRLTPLQGTREDRGYNQFPAFMVRKGIQAIGRPWEVFVRHKDA